MTFEEFVGTRKYVDCLGEAIRDDCLDKIAGYVYLDCLFIEDIRSWTGDVDHKSQLPLGRWYTYIENGEYDSDTLEDIERILYKWAVVNGYDCIELCKNGV